jgi:protoheme IX farnesyltransferase
LLKDYYRLTKPGIIYGNLMTVAAGFLLASKWHIDFKLFVSLLAGTGLIIASACVFNNYLDRGIDAKMARTKTRALVSGKISARNAIIYAAVLAVLGFAILTQTNTITFIIGVVAIFSYVVLYGVAKRKTVHGTLVGTIPGAASLVAGYTAVTGKLDMGALLLFLIMLAWQMAHFYSIALYRQKDYKNAGIPVLPVVKGAKRTKLEILLYTFLFVVLVTLLSLNGYSGLVFLLVMAPLGLYWLYKGLQGFDIKKDDKWGRQMFGFSLIVLLTLSVMLSVGSVLP